MRKGRIVINSVNVIIPAGKSYSADESVLSGPDILELQDMDKIVISKARKASTKKTDAPDASGDASKDAQTADGDKTTAKKTTKKGGAKKGGAKKTGAKTTKKTRSRGAKKTKEPEAPKPEEVTDQMGREAVIVDRGEVKKQAMGPGMHATSSEPQFLDTDSKDDDGADEERDPAFIDM